MLMILSLQDKFPKKIKLFKKQTMSESEISDLRLLTLYLKIEMAQENDQIILNQIDFAKRVLAQSV